MRLNLFERVKLSFRLFNRKKNPSCSQDSPTNLLRGFQSYLLLQVKDSSDICLFLFLFDASFLAANENKSLMRTHNS